MHTWEDPEINHICAQSQAKQNDWSKETQKKCPIKGCKLKKKKKDANYHEGTILQVHPYVYPHILFFFLINILLVSPLPIFVEDHFYEAKGPRALSLATVPGGLVAKIQCSHHPSLTSVFGQGTKVLQAEATRD